MILHFDSSGCTSVSCVSSQGLMPSPTHWPMHACENECHLTMSSPENWPMQAKEKKCQLTCHHAQVSGNGCCHQNPPQTRLLGNCCFLLNHLRCCAGGHLELHEPRSHLGGNQQHQRGTSHEGELALITSLHACAPAGGMKYSRHVS